MTALIPKQVSGANNEPAPSFASRGMAAGRVWDHTDGQGIYRRASPAVALMVGAGLPWTVSMISELSIPCM
jgi:hypothetical protein